MNSSFFAVCLEANCLSRLRDTGAIILVGGNKAMPGWKRIKIISVLRSAHACFEPDAIDYTNEDVQQ